MKVDEEIIAAAAEIIHGYSQSRQRVLRHTQLEAAPETVRLARLADAEGAITAYLAAMAERGFQMMPREPSSAMLKAAGDTAFRINPAMEGDGAKAVAFDSLSIYRAMFDANAKAKP